MQLEYHQLDRRWEHLRVRHPTRQRRLLASLAESGQQTPIVVVAEVDRYVVIDGYKRIAALEQLGRDTVEAVVWPMLAATRRLIRPPDRPPLGMIRSLAYFLPVIEEVLELHVSPDYFDYLRHKLARAGSKR
jgi:ParB-like chromosome segregation protein Spo0J